MASTYVNNLRLEEIGSGEQSGTWGDTTNTNLELIGQVTAWGTRAIANASTDNITIADGAADADRCLGLKLTGGGQACTVTLLPNTSSKTWFMYNATSYTLTFTCGSGANVAIPAGQTKVIATDGLGSGGVVHDLLTAVNLAGATVVDDLTVSDDLTVTDDMTVGGTLGVTGVVTANAGVVVDNITIDGNDISTTNSNGNLTITPNGTGNVIANTDLFEVKGAADESVSLFITAGEANNAQLVLSADESDDSGDDWYIHHAASNNQFKIQSDISGSAVSHVTITPNATVANSTFAAAGHLNVGHDFDVTGNAVIDGTALVTGVLTTTAATVFNGGFAANANSTITNADNTTQLALISTDGGAASGPSLELYRNSGSGASGDTAGKIEFYAEDANSDKIRLALLMAKMPDATNGSEDGSLTLFSMVGGTERNRISIDQAETTVNEDSMDVDFRVESNGNANMLFVDGGNDVVTIGGTTGETGDTFSVTNATNAINTRFVSTNDDANGVRLVLQKASTGPANNDEVAEIDFIGKDSAGNDEVYGFIQCFIDDVTSGTEDGILRFSTVTAATSRNRLDILPNETVFNEDGVGGINFRIETLNSTHALFVEGSSNNVLIGVGAESPLGKLHVKTADSAATAHANADEIVVESNNDAGISILSGQSYKGSLFFGDAGLNSDGRLEYSQGTRSMTLATAGTDAVIISSSGEMTKPLQPAFLAVPSADQNNIATGSAQTIVFGTEVYDVGANFASNTFTAPITGKYQLSASVYLSVLDTAATYYEASIRTSNRNYHNIIQPKFSSDPFYWTLPINVLADMDADDTAYVTIVQYDATQQTDVLTSSFFSGFLAC